MHIALVVERLAPFGGGVEQAAWQVGTALARAGESVHFFCREHEEAPPGTEVTRVSASGAWQPWRVSAFSRRVARALDGRRGDGFDVVHSFARTARQDVYRAGAGRHADYMEHAYGRIGSALRRLSPRHATALRADRRIFEDTTQWIQCPSHMVARQIVEGAGVAATRTVVIPNGVDADLYRPGRDGKSATLRSIHAPADETVWLLAGSGAHRKGIAVALRALARVRNEKTLLWIAGRDPVDPWRRAARRAGVAHRVHFLGLRSDMPDVYRAADGLLLPTRYDPFANASLEAAACGLPVVSTRNNGAMEVIDDGGIAVADAGDVGAVVAALETLADPSARAAMAVRARKRAVLADWTSHAERLRNLYEAVIDRRRCLSRGPRAGPAR